MSIEMDRPPSRPRPPLLKRLRPGHWIALDYVAGAIFGLMCFTGLHRVQVQQGLYGPPVFIQPPGVLLSLILAGTTGFAVARRRRRPGLMLALLLGVTFVAVVITSGAPKSLMVCFIAVAYALYLVIASYEDREVAVRALVAVALTVLAVAVVLGSARGGGQLPDIIPLILCLVVAWSIGYIVRQRRRYALGLQEEAASKAVAEERLRIARELHDVVAHSMSVIAVQAGYGQYVLDGQPEDARAALGAIQATSREALDDMRRMLGALRQADEGAPLTPPGQPGALAAGLAGRLTAGGVSADTQAADAAAASAQAGPWSGSGSPRPTAKAQPAPLSPAPGLQDLSRLISRTATVGVKAELVTQGTPRDLPPSIDLSAYRIVQESLTNVVKHANTAACRVRIAYSEDELTVEVTDNGAGAPGLGGAGTTAFGGAARLPGGALHFLPGGHGITGMRERVSLLGGEFVAGPLPGYGFRVTARIPLPALVSAGARS